MKQTAIAPANIAFIKYWGKKDEALRLPLNASLSMNLSGALTTTTIEFSPSYKKDTVEFLGESVSRKEIDRVIFHLDRIRKQAGRNEFARVATRNSFPKGTGIASSASGFAALTVAACSALELHVSEKELTILARLGSGSACRSIPDGFVIWETGQTSEESYAYSLYPSTYWDICDILAVVDVQMKKISTTQGHETVKTSPFWEARVKRIPQKIHRIQEAFREKNFSMLGEILEEDCLDMHHVMQTQRPPLYYWNATTRTLMDAVRTWRTDGLSVYFTIDAGPNVHLICEATQEKVLMEKVKNLHGVLEVISNKPSQGTRLFKDHLF
jgi:diphosphomevalonate decarboxylase